MPIGRMIEKEQEETIKCVQCGSTNTSPSAKEGRSKCNECNFSFDNDASKAAQKAGAIPEASPETLALAEEPNVQHVDISEEVRAAASQPTIVAKGLPIPRTPKYVFITKDRSRSEFVTLRELKKAALRWEASDVKYDCFELSKKQSVVKLEIE